MNKSRARDRQRVSLSSDALIRTSTANHARGQRKPDARVQHAGLLASRATDVICCMKTRDARRVEQEPRVFGAKGTCHWSELAGWPDRSFQPGELQ